MTLSEAHAALKAALPPGSDMVIELAMRDYPSCRPYPFVEIQVYDGNEWFNGRTLDSAVAACVAAHQPNYNPLAEAEAVLAEVQVVESAA